MLLAKSSNNSLKKRMKTNLPFLLVPALLFTIPAAQGAVDDFTGYSGSLYGKSGGSSSGGISWTGSWADQGFASSPNVILSGMGNVNGFASSSPYVEYPLNNSQGGINILEATRGFTSQSSQSSIFFYGLVAVGNFNSANSYGGIDLYQGSTEKLLIGERYGQGFWGATAGSALGSAGQNSSVAIGNFQTTLIVGELNQQSDTFTFWVNPDFNQTLAQNTPAFSLSLTGDATVDTIRLRGGNANDGNTWQFDNINVSTISPFAVPEPSTLAICGLSGLATFFMIRRRR